ncbi:MAG: hypothetical protein OEL83_08245 [Desulforhopalus sp.]|nr:hypothetical protein [Desulforhopalus sp.]
MTDIAQNLEERPAVITILCILGFIGVAFLVPKVFSTVAREIGFWYPPYLAIVGVVGLICNIGFWKMKKWGFYSYVLFVALNQIVMLSTGTWLPTALIVPVVVIIILAFYLRKMT